jgi:predicted nucleic acid-binding protein
VKIDSSPVYLDTSALAKLYVPESKSDELEAALLGRQDIIVSDLAVTELASAIGRRRREGDLTSQSAALLYRRVIADLTSGEFLRAELTSEVHRAAEAILLGASSGMRAADALHVATATIRAARTLITFDVRMATAVRSIGEIDVVGC